MIVTNDVGLTFGWRSRCGNERRLDHLQHFVSRNEKIPYADVVLTYYQIIKESVEAQSLFGAQLYESYLYK